ncbi:MAG: fructosamine kinase family protein [Longimicrobiales bacterium]
MTLPDAVRRGVEDALSDLGAGRLIDTKSVSGGCINHGSRLETTSGRLFFLKWTSDPPVGMYAAEADGLLALARASTGVSGSSDLHDGIRVPGVVDVGTDDAWLLLDFIPNGTVGDRSDEALGKGLATIHSAPTTEATFGWGRDNWIGSLPQPNPPTDRWSSFWCDSRIAPQLQRARAAGHFSSRSDGGLQMDRLLGAITLALDDVDTPALVHGDLWSGNAFADPSGRPVLIDPAVYLGDGEVDLAMTELFGGFGTRFYDAYHDVRSISEAYHAYRRDLYQLYYLLVHVNLFGGAYVAGSLRAAERVLGALL